MSNERLDPSIVERVAVMLRASDSVTGITGGRIYTYSPPLCTCDEDGNSDPACTAHEVRPQFTIERLPDR